MKKFVYLLSYLRYAFKILLRFLFSRKSDRIIIVATPTHGNLGDQAIVYAEKTAIKTVFPSRSVIEIENGAFLKCKKLLTKLIKQTDTIIVDGGGNLGTLWGWEDDKITDIISTFCQNKIVIFPQTMYYDTSDSAYERLERNQKIYSKATDLTFLLRDYASFDFFNKNFPNIKSKLCPDIVLSLNQQQSLKRKDILLCLRSDREKKVSEKETVVLKKHLEELHANTVNTDTVIKNSVRAHNRRRVLKRKWKEFSSAELVITDRLHAMIFSYITGTPCIAINNTSKKVEGSFQFINGCNFIKMADNLIEAIDIIPMLTDVGEINRDNFIYPINILEDVLKYGDIK